MTDHDATPDPALDATPDAGPGPRVEWLSVAGDADGWRSIGLTVTDDGMIPLVGTSIRLVPASDHPTGSGIVGWALSGTITGVVGEPGSVADVDGLSTHVVSPMAPMYAQHRVGASGLDHVVVSTADLERTSAAIAGATGCELKRIREVGSMRQGFHRIGRGGLIVELVERPDLPQGPASFWGLVLIVDDLGTACDVIGPERVSPPKDAVQPGRRIATIRGDVGLGLPVALMTL
jgi:hypothetical protein